MNEVALTVLQPVLDQVLGFSSIEEGAVHGTAYLNEVVDTIEERLGRMPNLASPHPDCVARLRTLNQTESDRGMANKLMEVVQMHFDAAMYPPDEVEAYWAEALADF